MRQNVLSEHWHDKLQVPMASFCQPMKASSIFNQPSAMSIMK